ncbi:cellulose synthase regulator protein [Klebsiella pneumoniae]|nr:cellulose synthase regulator protein [Klebsiella pneumoniae]
MPLRITPSVAEQEGQQTETEATGAPQKHHYTLNQQVGSITRESGVNSLRVGDIYYVGHLPWFERIWFALSNHPILLAIFAAISIVLLAWVLWRMLRIISRRRLSLDDE